MADVNLSTGMLAFSAFLATWIALTSYLYQVRNFSFFEIAFVSEIYILLNLGFLYILKRRLNEIGIENVGLTGSGLLRLLGYVIGNKRSDLDVIVVGKRDCMILRDKLGMIYDCRFVSYRKHAHKI